MATEQGNLLVAFELTDGNPLSAECQTVIDTTFDSDFFEGFTQGFFSEAIDINVGIKLGGNDSGKAAGGDTGKAGKGYGKFGAWNYNDVSSDDTVKAFPLEFEEVDIERNFDLASPSLFYYTCLKKTFSRIIVLRLRDTGTATAARPYLRLEFSEALFTNISWQDGETVKEKLQFRCRGFTSMYRTTDFYNNMGEAAQEPAEWDYDMALASDSES